MEENELGNDVLGVVEGNLNKIDLQMDDEIDLEGFAYRKEFAIANQAQGEVTYVPVRRPDPQSWIYIPSDSKMRATVAILELKQSREVYLVKPDVATSLDGEVTNRLIVPYQDREGGLFLWAVRLTDSRGNRDSWVTSALRIVHEYCDQWIKIKAMMNSGCYKVIPAPVEIPAPEWPAGGLGFLVNRAFKNKVINAVDDPVVQKLKGYL